MRQITYFGQTIEVTEAHLLLLVEGTVDSAHSVVRSLFTEYNQGFADATEQRGSPVPVTLGELRSLAEQIEDGELRRGVGDFLDKARQMVELNGELLAVVARFVNLPRPQDRQDRRRLRGRLRKYDRVGPRWASLTSFQRVLAEGARIYRALIHGKRQLGERLAELQAGLPGAGKRAPEPDIGGRRMEGPLGIALSVWGWLSSRNANGLPDVTGEWRALGEEALDGLRAAMPRIEDPVLHAAAETLYADLEWQVETGDRVLEGVARFAGLPVPRDEAGREALWEKLAEYDAAGPVWVREPALRRLQQEVLGNGLAAGENRLRIIARLNELYAEAVVKERRARAQGAGGEVPGPAGDAS